MYKSKTITFIKPDQLRYSRTQTCETGSCYPATGNLLIGRETQLSASSTCGIKKQERYCIVSHLEGPKKCFWCDSRYHNRYDKSLSHNISNIVDIHPRELDPWWQSENGVENVSIQLDMEAEFHFTHLVIHFKTFRPAAMLIERSQDRGRTWHVYRYFAHDCNKVWGMKPDIPRSLSDVICEEKYSYVNPSSGGELIFRVIPPNIPVEDPFATEVQELVKMTNLRVNFTKLHTLGDNLLDKREEIQEKYYYAINHMVVRGSCSCYGHASRCLPLPEKANSYYPPDMVHGQCECTHNTKGLNCNECEDFYNDLPWKPAFGKSQNACKRCNCNNHAFSCHFDSAVFELTGNVTGGVCDNCQHNTQGRNCEECIPFYYHDPNYDIQDPNACQPCDCDPRGSTDDGICDSHTDPGNGLESGRCHCKPNVDGRRCDRCKEGFWNFDENSPEGCQPCSCNIHGTINNQGCNVYTGECTCKRYVTGRDCNQCLPHYWGLSEDRDGCKPCNCDLGGAYDNDCDVMTGQCKCRPHVVGRTCDQPEQGHFTGYPDFHIYEAELSRGSDESQNVILEPNRDSRGNIWTGTGYTRAFEGSNLEFEINDIKTPMNYDLAVRYSPQLPNGWDDVRVHVEGLQPLDPNGPCAHQISNYETYRLHLPVESRSAQLPGSLCLEPGKTYKVRLEFRKYDPVVETPSASVLIDSLALLPRYEEIGFYRGSPENEINHEEFRRYRCGEMFQYANKFNSKQIPKICMKHLQSIGAFVHDGAFQCECDPTGSRSYECDPLGGQCDCKPNVVGRRCDKCAPGTYGFGPEGCIGRDLFLWDATFGDRCDRCIEGYYGDPRLGIDIPCRPCPCPGSLETGHSFASRCYLDQRTNDVVCECHAGYAGARCDVCSDNYFGDPELPGGSCQACNCSNNVDVTRPGNCDPKTGHCLQCLFNTEGEHCEMCKEGFYGDAINQQCRQCVCDLLGTNSSAGACDRITGQCPCLPNVIGLSCDTCKENHWKIASGMGCEPCECDPVGSYSEQCNYFDGQCNCAPGFGSRRCDQCQAYFWGDPKEKCHQCECDVNGSATLQCHRNNGTCICLEGIGGNKCDECARGYLGNAPDCRFCGECFKNWNDILEDLIVQSEKVILSASNIKNVGVQGAYTHKFLAMEKILDDVQDLLKNMNMSAQELATTENLIAPLRSKLSEAAEKLNETARGLETTEQQIKWVDLDLNDLNTQMNNLLEATKGLKENATKLQEANVEGALNLTRKAQQQSLNAEIKAIQIFENVLANSERQCKRAMTLYNRSIDEVNTMRHNNDRTIATLKNRLEGLNEKIPQLNEKVCGKAEVCDETCGGAKCGTCGGISCDLGAVTKANASFELVKKADQVIKEKEEKAEELLRGIAQAKQEASVALNASQEALMTAESAKNGSERAIKESSEFFANLEKFFSTPGAKPADIRAAAEETLGMDIHREPEQVRELSTKIDNAVAKLTNIDAILQETNADKETASNLKQEAVKVKTDAENILNVLEQVNKALDEAGDAQQKAGDAIQLANGDIAAAENDLTQIASESSDALSKANETMNTVNELNGRLNTLKRRFLKNQLSASEINEEVDAVSKDANNTLTEVQKLQDQYGLAEKKLTNRAGKSYTAKERALRLFERASQLFVNTNAKEKDLKDLEKWYEEKDKMFGDLNGEMTELSRKMDEYIMKISSRSKHYSECVS
ncbi:hypothetical protein RUM43_011842 [Polyplax serrata]|uniref:Laminin subunit beta-1 n=1 Tax=Polyplax serrata TaxID=468196 RepID=A0AAN8S7F1_POLSC